MQMYTHKPQISLKEFSLSLSVMKPDNKHNIENLSSLTHKHKVLSLTLDFI
ncbi:hypothetical protein Hanom_Chr02g00168041 [Helianthus anomalus]